jgi:hypothetical protein
VVIACNGCGDGGDGAVVAMAVVRQWRGSGRDGSAMPCEMDVCGQRDDDDAVAT